jgi:hypothetical protein
MSVDKLDEARNLLKPQQTTALRHAVSGVLG